MDTAQIPFALMDAVTRGDWARLERMCAQDVRSEWLNVMRFEDRASFVAVYRTDHRVLSDFRAEVTDLLVRDERSVCFRGRVGGRQSAPMVTRNGEYPATGKQYLVEFLCWLRLGDDNLITDVVYAFNHLAVWTQLGHVAQP